MGRCCFLLGILALAACGGGDGDDQPEIPWVAVTEGEGAALLSVWSDGANDVWVVGGDPRDGTGPLVFHYDGTAWTKLVTGEVNVDLWWVYGFANGPVFMSGSNGTILKFENGAFEKQVTPPEVTNIVFGLY